MAFNDSSKRTDPTVYYQTLLAKGLLAQKTTGRFCDVAIKILEHCVSLHSCVLAVFSPCLDNITLEKTAMNIIELTVDDFSSLSLENNHVDALNKVVDFIYTGEIDITEKDASLVKKIAIDLQLSQIINLCENIITMKDVEDNCVEKLNEKSNSRRNVNKGSLNRSKQQQEQHILKRPPQQVNNQSDEENSTQLMKKPNVRGEKKVVNSPKSTNNVDEKSLTVKTNSLKHSNKKLLNCSKCPFVTKSNLQLRTHEKQHLGKRYTCCSCGFVTLKVKPLLSHLREMRHEGLTCSLCSFEATNNQELSDHLQRHDHHQKPFFCLSCDARFQTRTALNLHLPKHSNQKPYICDQCGKGFKWKHALHSHIILHTQEKQHLCDQCGYRTAHQSSFKAHCLLHSGNVFKCLFPGCTFQAARKQNLTQHARTHRKEKPYQCEVCGYAFSLVKNLRRHARMHNANENLLRCTQCDFTTTRMDKLKEHTRKHNRFTNIEQAPTTLILDDVQMILDDSFIPTLDALTTIHSEVPSSRPESPLIPCISDSEIVTYSTIQMLPVYTFECINST